jgi:hypothetical protein
VPEYHVDESGPDHQKSFRASVRIGGRTYGEGEGRSKKEAEQQAAEAAWTSITAGGEGRVEGARGGEGAGEGARGGEGGGEGVDAAEGESAGGPQGARDVCARGAIREDAAAGGGLEDVGADGTDLPADSAGRANGRRRPQRRS